MKSSLATPLGRKEAVEREVLEFERRYQQPADRASYSSTERRV
jgi:hypothetical protein